MSFLAPAWLGLGLLAIPIVALYMLRMRRREVPVSSTLLWDLVVQDRQANTPWQRLRRNLLLILQLLILSALVLALARPAMPRPATYPTGATVILLDASASMGATDSKPSRFAEARSVTEKLVVQLPAESALSLILVGLESRVLVSKTRDPLAITEALAKAEPTTGSADWSAAFIQAAGLLSGEQIDRQVFVVSDGGLPSQGLPPLPAEVHYLPVGRIGENLAITAQGVRSGTSGLELFTRIANYGRMDRTLVLSLFYQGELLTAEYLTIQAGKTINRTFAGLPSGPGLFETRLSPSPDSSDSLDLLPLDDIARTIYQPTNSRRTLLLTRANFFLERMLAALPGIQAFRALKDPSGELRIPAEQFDLLVMDGWIPDPLPPGNLLLVNPPPNALFSVTGVFTPTQMTPVSDHPVVRFLNWGPVHVQRSRLVSLPAWAEPVIQSDGHPLVFIGQVQGRQIGVVSFDLHDSDLPLQVAFPILFSNLIDTLAPPQMVAAPQGLQPGQSIRLWPEMGTSGITVRTPSGVLHTLDIGQGEVSFDQTEEIGVYQVTFSSPEGSTGSAFTVNMIDPRESAILPARSITVGQTEILATQPGASGNTELWPYFTALALALLTAEWWVFHQGTGHPWPALSRMKSTLHGEKKS